MECHRITISHDQIVSQNNNFFRYDIPLVHSDERRSAAHTSSTRCFVVTDRHAMPLPDGQLLQGMPMRVSLLFTGQLAQTDMSSPKAAQSAESQYTAACFLSPSGRIAAVGRGVDSPVRRRNITGCRRSVTSTCGSLPLHRCDAAENNRVYVQNEGEIVRAVVAAVVEFPSGDTVTAAPP
jgi:hypothetical protein